MSQDRHLLRRLEAILFASPVALDEKALAARLPEGTDVSALVLELAADYAPRGVTLVRRGEGWAFRTASDLAGTLAVETIQPRRLSRAAIEVLAIIAYHQPVTRGEIEETRGVALSKGTLDTLLEAGWIRPKGRRHTPGRPLQWATTDSFLDHFALESLDDLPGIEELKASGFLESRPSAGSYGMRAIDQDEPVDTEEADEPLDGGADG